MEKQPEPLQLSIVTLFFELFPTMRKSLHDCVFLRYGGCHGNLNSFKSLQRCTEICCGKGYT
ncbi:Kunitz/Bovine pancreatic trypsin inhibitor domain protein [Ancylostoma duodenale]|uniref:Kunitz/Bovine pancreatic trypsin inhibitor domain protein n=1 Tax=Ancylostoma duodenale TaxID=51022 RepID=A0A0C2GN64_9BILA|nr:Kunitz/Bovine pancreatic trypsin inhibitor domain protein [Ancylostoma duodenale]